MRKIKAKLSSEFWGTLSPFPTLCTGPVTTQARLTATNDITYYHLFGRLCPSLRPGMLWETMEPTTVTFITCWKVRSSSALTIFSPLSFPSCELISDLVRLIMLLLCVMGRCGISEPHQDPKNPVILNKDSEGQTSQWNTTTLSRRLCPVMDTCLYSWTDAALYVYTCFIDWFCLCRKWPDWSQRI